MKLEFIEDDCYKVMIIHSIIESYRLKVSTGRFKFLRFIIALIKNARTLIPFLWKIVVVWNDYEVDDTIIYNGEKMTADEWKNRRKK